MMPLPPVTTIAACGSILTACKSAWELSRMIKKKDQEKRLDSQARSIIYELRQSYMDGLMDQKAFDKWYDRLLGAIAEKDGKSSQVSDIKMSVVTKMDDLGPELQKIKAHLLFIRRDKGRTSGRSVHANSSSAYRDEKHVHRARARSMDRRQSRGPPPMYTVEEYEERRRRPSHVDTVKAQRDYYYAHALPSPYRSEIEYTPQTDEFDDSASSSRRDDREGRGRHSSHRQDRHRDGGSGSRTESYRSQSSSTTGRGRTRSRSVHVERRVNEEVSSDADSEPESAFARRRSAYYTRNSGAAGQGGSGRGGGR